MSNAFPLVARRRALKMTQDHLAGAASVSRSTVQRAERGLLVSDENLRSLLAVLGLTLEDLTAQVPAVPTPAPRQPVDTSIVWSLELLLVAVLLVTFVTLRIHPEWLEPAAITAEAASLRFHLLMGYLGIGLAGCILTGRILWRRWKAPDADRMAFLSWRRVGRVRVPIPGLRWTSLGRTDGTWAGGLLAAAMTVFVTFWAHHPTVGSLVNPARPTLGFDDANKVSGAWAVEPSSPLAEAGLRVGDLVVSAGGSPVAVHLDLVAAVRDAEGEILDVMVARPRPRGANGQIPPAEMLTLPVQVRRDPAGCGADTPCGWAGSLTGLFSPLKTTVPMENQVHMFLREVGTVARMVVAPEMRGHSELRVGHGQGFRAWLDWLTFRMAAGSGITLTFAALVIVLGLQHGLAAVASWKLKPSRWGGLPWRRAGSHAR